MKELISAILITVSLIAPVIARSSKTSEGGGHWNNPGYKAGWRTGHYTTTGGKRGYYHYNVNH